MFPGITRITSKMPEKPKNADFAIYIDFDPGTKDPERIFQAADQAIRSFRELDHILCKTVDSEISPIMPLEEIEAGSIKIWLRTLLEVIDDGAIKNMDWKPAVGKYLLNAKYALIEWSNKEHKDLQSIKELQSGIREMAEDTGVKKMPFYGEMSTKDITNVAENINNSKKLLHKSDKMKYVTQEDEIEFDMAIDISPENIQDLVTKETMVSNNNKLILGVKKPDYLASSKWDMKHGNKTQSVSIEDSDWLEKFQSREIDVRPGDSLDCMVRIERKYGHDNELLSEQYFVVSVNGVVSNQFFEQSDLISPP